MFKKFLLTTTLAIFIGVLIFGAYYRTQAKSSDENNAVSGGARRGQLESNPDVQLSGEASGAAQGGGGGGSGAGRGGAGRSSQGGNGRQFEAAGEGVEFHPAIPAGELSAAEVAALQYMREEEKLAYDIYTALYTRWGMRTFTNIARSEQVHTTAVADLLAAYGVPDPASTKAGVFNNPDLQALYNTLLEQGSQSQAAALDVGILVEETDIADLQQRLQQTSNAAIQQVFNVLLRGSTNHLNAFTRAAEAQTGGQRFNQEDNPGSASQAGAAGQGGGQGGNGYRGGNGRQSQQP